jgi:hypothetical protein
VCTARTVPISGTRQQETVAEEQIVRSRDPVGRLAQRAGSGDGLRDLVLEKLRVEQLLGVLPFVQRLRFVEALVTLQADQLSPGRLREGARQIRFPDTRRAFYQHRFFQPVREKDAGGDLGRRQVPRRAQSALDVRNARERDDRHRPVLNMWRCVARFALASLLHIRTDVNRRVALILAALLVPGGLLVLMGAVVVRAIARSGTGRKAWDRVTGFWRRTAPAADPVQQAA